jgi:hypothetical protein
MTHYRDQNAISEVIAKVERKPGRIMLTSLSGGEFSIRLGCVAGWRTHPGFNFIHVYVIGAGLFSFTETKAGVIDDLAELLELVSS